MSKAPTDAPVVGVRDVLVAPTTHVEGDYLNEMPAGNPAVQLTDDLTIERLPHEEVELVMNACTLRGHYFYAVRQFGQRYSFVRRLDPAVIDENHYGWDDGHLIYYTTALSRLVHDNTHSLAYAARVVDHADGEQQVIPVDAPGWVAMYRLRHGRDWLTEPETHELRQLIADYLPLHNALPWKIVHALNLGEDAVRLQLLQRALLLISTGLEGLIQSDPHRVRKQFRERLPLLAHEVAVDGVDEQFARDLYTARSEAAHGAPVSMFHVELVREEGEEGDDREESPEQPHGEPEQPEAEEDVAAPLALAQDLLRATVRKAIQDPAFRAIFESDDTVRAKWPVQL